MSTENVKYYDVHDNGAISFRVDVYDTKIHIFDVENNNKFTCIYNYEKIFVKGGIGDPDGNTVLINTKGTEYIFVGSKIEKFVSLNKIINFVSEIGPNDVPYPYAIDVEGHYYLLIEYVVLSKYNGEDPYGYYYQGHQMSMLIAGRPNVMWSSPFKNIYSYSMYSKDDGCFNEYGMVYHPWPDKWPGDGKYRIKYESRDELFVNISFDEFKSLLKEFGDSKGYIPLKMDELIE